MTAAKPAARDSKRVRRTNARRSHDRQTQPIRQRWRTHFLEKLAETSNVRESCEHAGVTATTVYDLRRKDPGFAAKWREALLEGYDNLEMETLHRLRAGPSREGPKFDIANSLRLLIAHRESVARERARRGHEDERQVLAELDAKLEMMRRRQIALARLLAEEEAGIGDRG